MFCDSLEQDNILLFKFKFRNNKSLILFTFSRPMQSSELDETTKRIEIEFRHILSKIISFQLRT